MGGDLHCSTGLCARCVCLNHCGCHLTSLIMKAGNDTAYVVLGGCSNAACYLVTAAAVAVAVALCRLCCTPTRFTWLTEGPTSWHHSWGCSCPHSTGPSSHPPSVWEAPAGPGLAQTGAGLTGGTGRQAPGRLTVTGAAMVSRTLPTTTRCVACIGVRLTGWACVMNPEPCNNNSTVTVTVTDDAFSVTASKTRLLLQADGCRRWEWGVQD